MHPTEWRNIPECVRYCCEVLHQRLTTLEDNFKRHTENYSLNNQKVNGNLQAQKRHQDEQITMMKQQLHRAIKEQKEKREELEESLLI